VSKILDTARLSFRQIEAVDGALIRRLYTDPKVTRGFGREPYSNMELDAKMQQLLIDWVIDGNREFVVCERQTGAAVGIGGIRPTAELNVGEIGYVFLPRWWGMGFATEAIEAWTRWAFEALSLTRIVAEGVENPASVRALEKVGYTVFVTETTGSRTLKSLEIANQSWQQGRVLP
jgi:ribosomal-protein-alanine N-acetyltransferase